MYIFLLLRFILNKQQQMLHTIIVKLVLAAAMIRYAKGNHDLNCVCSSSKICTNCKCIISSYGTIYIDMQANPVAVSCTSDADVRLYNSLKIKLIICYKSLILNDNKCQCFCFNGHCIDGGDSSQGCAHFNKGGNTCTTSIDVDRNNIC